RGRFTLALEATEHDDRRPVLDEVEAVIDRPHKGDEFLVDDADDLLAGVEAPQDGLADGPLGDASDEGVDDVEVDVSVEQRTAALLQAVADVRLGESSPAAQLLEDLAQRALQPIKHDPDTSNRAIQDRPEPVIPETRKGKIIRGAALAFNQAKDNQTPRG